MIKITTLCTSKQYRAFSWLHVFPHDTLSTQPETSVKISFSLNVDAQTHVSITQTQHNVTKAQMHMKNMGLDLYTAVNYVAL